MNLFRYTQSVHVSPRESLCCRGYRGRMVFEGLLNIGEVWETRNSTEKDLLLLILRLSVSNTCTGCAVKPRDKMCLLTEASHPWKKKKIAVVFVFKK